MRAHSGSKTREDVKVGLIRDGEWYYASETVIGQFELQIPMVDVISIGAGGGSVAWVDGGRLSVGPRSVGARPGPARYDAGGSEPTVTDADLVLGYLNPDYFVGGRMALSRDRAEGIRRVTDAHMADLIRKATIERGHRIDPVPCPLDSPCHRPTCRLRSRAKGPSDACAPVEGSGIASGSTTCPG